MENFITQKNRLSISLMKSGDFFMSGFPTKVTDNERQTAWTDENGLVYSFDHKRLLGTCNNSLSEYIISEGTEVICDGSLNDLWKAPRSAMAGVKVTIPSSVLYIGRNPFMGNYKSMICNSPYFVVENEALYTSDKKLLVSCFSNSTEFVIPDGVEQIGSFAFYGCNIMRIIIPESISYIGDNPFININSTNGHCLDIICNSKRFFVKNNAIYWTNPQKLIAYWGNNPVCRVEENTVALLSNSLFKGVKNLYLPNSVRAISSESFGERYAIPQHFLIPKNYTEKFNQFLPEYKEQLIQVDLDTEWFDDFGVIYSADRTTLKRAPKDLACYSILYGTEKIGDYSFCCCHNLTDVKIPSSVKKIGISAFRDCSSLKEIDLPNSVKTIKSSAFSECKAFKKVFLPNTLVKFESSHFLGCNNLSQIIIPSGTKDKFIEMLPSFRDEITELKDIGLYSEEATDADFRNAYKDEYGAFYSFDMTRLLKGPDVASYKIRCGTMVICKNAFFYHKNLVELFIPDTVVQIGESAFSSCINLAKVRFSESISVIKKSTFEYCHALTELAIPKSVKEIHQNAFADCINLSNVVFHDSLQRIGYQAFSACKNLTHIVIPASVSYIETFAFAGCHELSTVDVLGVPKLGNGIFEACTKLFSIYMPSWKKRRAKDYLGRYSLFLDRTRDYPFKETWTLEDFIHVHGELNVQDAIDEVSGYIYKSCVFTNSTGNKCYARDDYYWGGEYLCQLPESEEKFRIGVDSNGDYQLYDKTLDFWQPGMSFGWEYD